MLRLFLSIEPQLRRWRIPKSEPRQLKLALKWSAWRVGEFLAAHPFGVRDAVERGQVNRVDELIEHFRLPSGVIGQLMPARSWAKLRLNKARS